MNFLNEYEVSLWEDKIKRDENGSVVHHPLNGKYIFSDGRDMFSYGYLSFCGHDMDKSPLMDDVKVFHLEFNGEPDESHNREAWADPLRAEVLKRLTGSNRCWYLSMIDGWREEIGDALQRILDIRLSQTEVQSERPYGSTYGFMPRQFFEVPNRYLPEVVQYFWSEAVPGYPIEGYNMDNGQINLLKQWDDRPRDDHIFRDVIDLTFVNFYTFPAEHCYFVFVTNKLNYDELADLIGLEELQEQAKEMSREKK